MAMTMATSVSSFAPTSRVLRGVRSDTRLRESFAKNTIMSTMSLSKRGVQLSNALRVFQMRVVGRGSTVRVGAPLTVASCTPNSAHNLRPPSTNEVTHAVVSQNTKIVNPPSFVGNVATSGVSSVGTTFSSFIVPLLISAALALFAVCLAGFLVCVRELVRACREATIASRAVTRCADSIDSACAALEKTLIKTETVLEDVGKIGSTTSSVLETASREAGVLQRRLSDLPNTASRTLMEAITRQYASPLPSVSSNGNANSQSSGVWAGDVRIAIGAVIEGNRDGNRWIGGKTGCNFGFNRSNRFRVGEYCAVPRNDNTYTWGVIELNDRDYSVDDSGESSEFEEDAPSCVWPPRDPDAIPDTCVDGSLDFEGNLIGNGNGERSSRANTPGSWLERTVVSFIGDERAESVEGWVRSATGLTAVEEQEYKVVVELDTDAYSFKIMNAGDLGKRRANGE